MDYLQQIAAGLLARDKARAEGRTVSPAITKLLLQAANRIAALPPEAQAAAAFHLQQAETQLQGQAEAHAQHQATVAVDKYADRLAHNLGSRDASRAATMEGGAHKPWSLQEVQAIANNERYTHSWKEKVTNKRTGKSELVTKSEQRRPHASDNRRANIILGMMQHEVSRLANPHPHDNGAVLDGIDPQLLAEEGRQGDVARAFDYVEANPERFESAEQH